MHRRHSHFHCWRCGFHWTQFCAFYKSWTSYIISLLISAEYTSFTPTKKLDKEMWNVLLAEPTGHLKNSKVNQISMDWVGCRIQSEDRRCTLDICIIVMSFTGCVLLVWQHYFGRERSLCKNTTMSQKGSRMYSRMMYSRMFQSFQLIWWDFIFLSPQSLL